MNTMHKFLLKYKHQGDTYHTMPIIHLESHNRHKFPSVEKLQILIASDNVTFRKEEIGVNGPGNDGSRWW